MASILLRPYFEKMSAYVGEYGHLFLKYAIAAGLLNVIEKTAALLPSVGVRKALTDFAAVYRHLNYADAFKGIQRSVLDNVRDTLCAYEFNLYTDRGFTDLEILLYVGNETLDYERLREFVDLQASAVCSAKGVKRLNNLRFVRSANILSRPFSPARRNDVGQSLVRTSPALGLIYLVFDFFTGGREQFFHQPKGDFLFVFVAVEQYKTVLMLYD